MADSDPQERAAEPLAHEQHHIAIVRKLFIGGCFLLPWLWIVALIHYRHKVFDATAPVALRKCKAPPLCAHTVRFQ